MPVEAEPAVQAETVAAPSPEKSFESAGTSTSGAVEIARPSDQIADAPAAIDAWRPAVDAAAVEPEPASLTPSAWLPVKKPAPSPQPEPAPKKKSPAKSTRKTRNPAVNQLGDEAARLIAELEVIIASLLTGAPRAAAPLHDATSRLSREIKATHAQDAALDDLRKTVTSVKRRRRDVEAMMELMAHIDTVSTLQAQHEALVAAAEKLLVELESAGAAAVGTKRRSPSRSKKTSPAANSD